MCSTISFSLKCVEGGAFKKKFQIFCFFFFFFCVFVLCFFSAPHYVLLLFLVGGAGGTGKHYREYGKTYFVCDIVCELFV